MKTVVVTGATNFIGVHFVRQMIDRDVRVFAVVRPDSPKIKQLQRMVDLVPVYAEMSEYVNLDKMITEPCDAFFHLAWNGTRGTDRMDAQIQQENYMCSMKTLETAQRMGCKTFISAGTQAEYGNCNGPVTEETPCAPNTEYGKSKLRFFYDASEFCKSKGVRFIEPRFFSVYGPGDAAGTMVSSMLTRMMQNKPCELTECIQLWDFLHVDDAARGVAEILMSDCADGVYNLGYGIPKPLRWFVEEMYRISGATSELQFGVVPYPPTGMVSLEPLTDKIRKLTDWSPRISFTDGIEGLVSDMKAAGVK